MVATSITPFPFRTSPVSDIAPVSYRDSSTFLEELEQLSHWLETVLVPETNGMIDSTRAAWLEYFDAFMANVNLEIVALNENNFQRITSPLTYGAIGDGVTVDLAFIQSAVNATPEGGTLVFPETYTFNLGTGAITVDKGITLRGGAFLTSTGKAFSVTNSNVTIDGATITGPGTVVPYVAGNAAISVQGTLGEYLENVVIKNCVIVGMRDTGIRFEYVEGFEISGNVVHDFRYGGIMLNSGRSGTVTRNDIRHAVQDLVGLSYGIAITDIINHPDFRSENVDVSHNHVEDVPDWEALDSHGGKNISFLYNTVKDCRYGVVLTVGSDTRMTAPIECRVIGNHISAPNLITIKNCYGVAIGGSSPTNPMTLKADAVIANNTFVGLTTDIALATSTGPNVDLKKSKLDTGWLDAETYGNFNIGYASNSTYPVKMRIQNGVVKFEGVVSLTGEAPQSTVFFILDRLELIPGYDRIMGNGKGVAAPFDSFVLSVNTAGSYRTVFPNTVPATNFTVTGEYQL